MIPRSGKSWLLIAIGMIAAACLMFLLLALLEPRAGLARVNVPGSNLALVLFKDEKHLYRYDVLADGKKVASDVLLGSRGTLESGSQVSILGDRVSITFRTTENGAPFVEFDLAECRIVRHSNESLAPPPIKNCRRK
ncbi:MAG: hypothetical protein ABI821_09515 [Pseudomonadota bacterium]